MPDSEGRDAATCRWCVVHKLLQAQALHLFRQLGTETVPGRRAGLVSLFVLRACASIPPASQAGRRRFESDRPLGRTAAGRPLSCCAPRPVRAAKRGATDTGIRGRAAAGGQEKAAGTWAIIRSRSKPGVRIGGISTPAPAPRTSARLGFSSRGTGAKEHSHGTAAPSQRDSASRGTRPCPSAVKYTPWE